MIHLLLFLFNTVLISCLNAQSADLLVGDTLPKVLKDSFEQFHGPPINALPDILLPVVANTSYGKVRGFRRLSSLPVDVFYGIPYAKAPVGQLRFEMPVEPDPWHSVLPTTVHRSACYPHATPDFFNVYLQQIDMSEDCLYLNIFRPHKVTAGKLLPVLVFIHGGGFEIGSSRLYSNYEDIGNNFVLHGDGMVVVSYQYRLGVLGFASTGDDEMPGNLGLWDQLLALKFIKENIENFDGDPNQITLFGQSAGSASVSVLGVSPHTRIVNETAKLANVLECDTENSAAIKECLKEIPAVELLIGVDLIGAARVEPNSIKFAPRFDGNFFSKDIPELIAEAPKKPTIISHVELEALIFTLYTGINGSISSFEIPWTETSTYTANQLWYYIRTRVAYAERYGNESETVANEIFEFYTNSTNQTSTNMINQYTLLISDLLFVVPIIMEIKQKADLNWPLYYYYFTYARDAAFLPGCTIHKAYHFYDHQHVIANPFMFYVFNEQDLKIQAFMLESLRNFITTGNPSTQNSVPLEWPKVPNSTDLQNVQIMAPSPSVQGTQTDVHRRYQFWMEMVAKYPQFNIVREIPGQ